jgi:hypothetical protein
VTDPLTTADAIAFLGRQFVSPNVLDENLEPSNVVDVLADIAAALWSIAHRLEPALFQAAGTVGGERDD